MTRTGMITGQRMMQLLSLAGLLGSVAAAVWGWRTGVLTDQERLAAAVAAAGIWGPLVFTVFQAVQVVVPILPGGIGCLAGVLLFGPWKGFLWNYIGICIGSLAAFAVARSCGKPLLSKLFPEKLIVRYRRWGADRRFAQLFAAAIFFPVAPDDFLCYLAGTTDMTWRCYTAIILLGKPFAIALYSLGLTVIWKHLAPLISTLL